MAESLPGARARSAAQRDAADVETRARGSLGGYASFDDFAAVLAEVRTSCERVGLLECAEEVRRAREIVLALSTALTSSREGALREAAAAVEALRYVRPTLTERLAAKPGLNNAVLSDEEAEAVNWPYEKAAATIRSLISTPQEQA